jgi:hypothetical protein
MTRDGTLARQAARVPVQLTTGERIDMGLVLQFNGAGALVHVAATLAPSPRATTSETAAALLVEAIGGKLRRRPDIGIREMRRRAEAALALLEKLEDLEDRHGAEARQMLAGRAA